LSYKIKCYNFLFVRTSNYFESIHKPKKISVSTEVESGQLRRCNDSLPFGRPGDRILIRVIFFAQVQTDSKVHPGSYRMGTGPFSSVKRPGCFLHHQTSSRAEVRITVELYFQFPSGLRGQFYIELYIYCIKRRREISLFKVPAI